MSDFAKEGKDAEQYPEAEKWGRVHDQVCVIVDFLDWMTATAGLLPCHQRPGGYDWIPDGQSAEKLAAGYFGIDLERLETERRAMLDSLRAAAGEG